MIRSPSDQSEFLPQACQIFKMTDRDTGGAVLIVGLGLVGTFTAILLSQQGYQVRCIERRSFSETLSSMVFFNL